MWTVFALLAPLAGLSGAQAANGQKKVETGKRRATTGASLTGCLDEKEGHYILVDDRSLEPVADLEADGFPTEGFAKHMGHKVTVQGTSNTTGTRPVFKVRTIETVSETCAPTPQAEKK
jgi:hypothetical protein